MRLPWKFVSVLMIAITLTACKLLSENILVFAAICLIASLAFAASCGFSARTIRRKMLVCLILALACYAAAHILTDYGCCRSNHLAAIKDAIIQFGTHLAEFAKTLQLTAWH